MYNLIQNPFFQRLRYIRQLGLTDYVYPGASHTRFLHSLGAFHLIDQAISTLRLKGVEISPQEAEAVSAAILLHDIGHGPFSHALESVLIEGISHEEVSLFIMKVLNKEFDGRLTLAIDMFQGNYKRKFFHDLISSQIDMDRLDYLVRDSFYTGVIEGSVGADRIIKMLNVSEERLVVDEKGIYSIEKFLIARRFMYWQVYMHKTVLSAERLLINILKRARELTKEGKEPLSTPSIRFFLRNNFSKTDLIEGKGNSFAIAHNFLAVDDNEMLASLKLWSSNGDATLSDLSRKLLFRDLPAIELSNSPFDSIRVEELREKASVGVVSKEDLSEYYIYTGSVSNLTYAPSAPTVKILDKRGKTKEITEVSDMLNHKALSKEITKFFLCYPKEIRDLK
jgi:hypothetical protein